VRTKSQTTPQQWEGIRKEQTQHPGTCPRHPYVQCRPSGQRSPTRAVVLLLGRARTWEKIDNQQKIVVIVGAALLRENVFFLAKPGL
jgi:hypothetical protein